MVCLLYIGYVVHVYCKCLFLFADSVQQEIGRLLDKHRNEKYTNVLTEPINQIYSNRTVDVSLSKKRRRVAV